MTPDQLRVLLFLLAAAICLVSILVVVHSGSKSVAERKLLLKLLEELRAMQPALPTPTVDEYRRLFATAPIGSWTDCIDEHIGMGFSGVSGKFSETSFKEDGTGRWACEEEEILFEWQSLAERVIKVRCVQHIPPLEGWTPEELEEEQQWYRVEYDFLIPKDVRRPVIYDVNSYSRDKILDGTIDQYMDLQFLGCFGYRFGGPLKLYNTPLMESADEVT